MCVADGPAKDRTRAEASFSRGENERPFDEAKLAIVETFFLAAALLGNDFIKAQTSLFANSIAVVAGFIRVHDSSCYDAKATMVT